DDADPPGVELLLVAPRLQPGEVPGLQQTAHAPEGHVGASRPGEHYRLVLGDSRAVLLPVGVADAGIRLHHDARTRTVPPGTPGSLAARVPVVVGDRVLAEVPDPA